MCGICGFAHADPGRRVDTATVRRMNEALTHRGPDDAGFWDGGHVALAMRRLSIVDLSGGRQPMTNEDGSVALVFNGEIYNFTELRERLEKSGHVFRTDCDTEVIVHAYEQYGDDALCHFNGMFAFALYDRSRERLLLARDRLGIKPLYYSFRDGVLVFASELDALLRSGVAGGALNPAAVDAYFAFLYIPAPDTIFRDAHKLRPGEKLVFEKGEVKKERYWRVAFEPDHSLTLDSAADAYMELLTDAVRLRRMSDVPLGVFLSGGVDSSSVVGILSLMMSGPVKTFTIGFDDKHVNELRFARTAADWFATQHTEEILTPDMVALVPTLARHFGEPFADSSAVPTWLVSKIARERVTVALSGDGGDELFAGYSWTHMNRRVNAYRRVPAALRRLIGVAVRMAPASPTVAKLERFNQDSFLTPQEGFRRRETCFGDGLRASLYQPGLAQQVAACATDRFQEPIDTAGAMGRTRSGFVASLITLVFWDRERLAEILEVPWSTVRPPRVRHGKVA